MMVHADDQSTNITGGVRAPAGDTTRAYLVVLNGSAQGEMHAIDRALTTVGRGDEVTIRLVDSGVSREHACIRLDGDDVILEDLNSTNGTWCNGERVATRTLQDGDKIALGETTLLKFTFHDYLDQIFAARLFDAARRDPLTKLYKRRYFTERLASEFAYARRHKTPLAVLFIDIDNFKAVNDTFGHPAGDHALRECADLVAASIRVEDLVARFGGEEIIILGRGLDTSAASALGERLRALVAGYRVEWHGQVVPLTVSIGVATVPAADILTPEQLVGAADRAMYAAKSAGRNRVSAHQGMG